MAGAGASATEGAVSPAGATSGAIMAEGPTRGSTSVLEGHETQVLIVVKFAWHCGIPGAGAGAGPGPMLRAAEATQTKLKRAHSTAVLMLLVSSEQRKPTHAHQELY